MATRTLGRLLEEGNLLRQILQLESPGPREFTAAPSPGWPLELGLRHASVGVQPHEEFRGSLMPLRVTDVGLKRSNTRCRGRGQPLDECARASNVELQNSFSGILAQRSAE